MKTLRVYRRRNKRLRAVGFQSYRDYLQSPVWADIRARVLARDGGKCVACRSQAQCVHHTNYTRRNLSPEAGKGLPALVSLCHRCHRFIELDRDGAKGSAKEAMQKLRWLCRKYGTTLPGRCPGCLMGGKPKDHDLCRKCRQRRKSPASGTTAIQSGNERGSTSVRREIVELGTARP